MRIAYDSLYNLSSIPWKPGDLILAYINGRISSGNYAKAKLLFPQAEILSITTDGDPNARANICDCEYGDYTIAAAAEWANNESGDTIYASLNTWPSVKRLINPQILSRINWLATTLDGNTNVPGSVGVQYQDTGLYDISLITNDLWYPASSVVSGKVRPMRYRSTAGAEILVDGSFIYPIPNTTKAALFDAAQVPVITDNDIFALVEALLAKQ